MSAERWGPVWELRLRLASCGHSVSRSQVPLREATDYVCPICGGEQDMASPVFSSRDFVPTMNLTWGDAKRTHVQHFQNVNKKTGGVRTLGDLAAEVSRSRACIVDLRRRTINLGALGDESAEMIVVRGRCFGATVKSGAIAVPKHGAMVLEGRGAHFTDVSFSGGALVCIGASYSGTFRRCRFECAVCIVHGAAAAFADCTFLPPGRGLTASGGATTATLSRCRFSSCPTSIIAEHGATVCASATAITDTRSAAIVNGPGSRVSLVDCTLRGSRGAPHTLGMLACNGAASVRRCEVSQFGVALHAAGPAAAIEVRGMHARQVRCGVLVEGQARVTVRQSEMAVAWSAGTGDRGGILLRGTAVGDGARGQLERCSLHSGPDCAGLDVQRCSALAATLCQVQSHDAIITVRGSASRAVLRSFYGFSADAALACLVSSVGTSLSLHDATLVSAASTCAAECGGRVCAVDCTLKSVEAAEMVAAVHLVDERAAATLLRCSIAGALIGVCSAGGRVIAKQCHVREHGTEGQPVPRLPGPPLHMKAFLCQGGSLHLEGGSVVGALVAVELRESVKATVTGIEVTGCTLGVVAVTRSTVLVSGCQFQGLLLEDTPEASAQELDDHAAVWLDGVEGVVIQESRFSGWKLAVEVDASENVEIRDSEFRTHSGAEAGAGVVCNSDASIQNCTFVDMREGVSAAGCSVAMSGNQFGPGVSIGCAVDAAASVSAQHVRFYGCARAVLLDDNATVTARDCQMTACESAFAAEASGFLLTMERVRICGRRGTGVGAIALLGKPAFVRAIDCTVSDVNVGIMLIGRQLQATLLRCEVTACTSGVLFGDAASAHVSQVHISGKMGVMIGPLTPMPVRRCGACGREGEAADAAAWSAGRKGRALVAAAAQPRCVHEGAFTRVTMEDCHVVDCEHVGVHVMTHGHLDARRVHVARCAAGIRDDVLGVRSSFSDCGVVIEKSVGAEAATGAVAYLQGAQDVVTLTEPAAIPGVCITESALGPAVAVIQSAAPL